MRLLATSAIAIVAAALAANPAAAAETVISTATTAPVTTSALGDIRISATGSIKPASGAAVTINSSNNVTNQGTIAIQGANGAVGIVANPNLTGNITNSGTITIDENYTPKDNDNDGDIDGAFATGSGRYGIHISGGGNYWGTITNSGAIGVEGNNSAGIAIDSLLAGTLISTGKISVLGDNSVGIRTADVLGNVSIGTGSTTAVQGANSIGLLIGGNVGGAVTIQGNVSSTGYRSITPPADTSKFDADDLLQGGSAVVVGGSVAGGILVDTAGLVATYGSAPALVIGSSTVDSAIGPVAGSSFGHGLVINGKVTGSGLYSGVDATAVEIGGKGHVVAITGGMTVGGTVSASANKASATAVHIGAGGVVPQLVVGGTISSEAGGADGALSTAILIDSGATANAIFNGGTIKASQTGDSGTASAIVDKSGTLALVQNSGAIAAGSADGTVAGTAIDLSANTTGAVVRQIAPATDRPAPSITGDIRFGSGNDTLDIQAGVVNGNVNFGAGTDLLALSGGGIYRGTISGSSALSATVGAGSLLDAQGTANLAALTLADNASLGVTVGTDGATLYNVGGTATFGAGSKVVVTIDSVGNAPGTYTILDAGTLVGGDNLTSAIATLPFLFDSSVTADASEGTVVLDVALKEADELGINGSELAIIDAALDAADADRPLAAVFLAVEDASSLRDTLQQLLPEHAGGVFETATKGSRLATGILSDPRPVSGLWLQQVAGGSSKSLGDTASYKLDTWGASIGYGVAVGRAGTVGLTAGYYYGKDRHLGNELQSDHYEGGAYWVGEFGPLHGWARAMAGTIDFDSKRNFTSALTGTTVARSNEANWKGRIYSGSGGVSYDFRSGRLSIRPNASIEYYKLNEDAYAESGGGAAFDLEVGSRTSSETAANAMVSLGYDLLSLDPEAAWLRVELEGGRREILGGSLGETVASFHNGAAFTLRAEDRTSGWRGGLRMIGGGTGVRFGLEGNAEQQQGNLSIGARMGLNLAI